MGILDSARAAMGGQTEKPEDQGNGHSKPFDSGEKAAISDALIKVKSGHGGARKGSGRKPNSAKALESAPAEREEQLENPPSAADVEFVSKTAIAVVNIVDRLISTKVYDSVYALNPPHLKDEAEKFARKVVVLSEEKALLENAFSALAAKYAFLSRYAPEMALAGWAASYGMRVDSVLKEVKQLTVAVNAMKVKDADRPQAQENSDSR